LVSKLHKNDQWWFGIKEIDWTNWDSNSYLALIMRDGLERSYLMLNPEDANYLINKLNISEQRSKEIHIGYPNTGPKYIVEWKDFHCQDQIKNLSPITQEEILAAKKARKVGDEELL
jgi:hypothetical protein